MEIKKHEKDRKRKENVVKHNEIGKDKKEIMKQKRESDKKRERKTGDTGKRIEKKR